MPGLSPDPYNAVCNFVRLTERIVRRCSDGDQELLGDGSHMALRGVESCSAARTVVAASVTRSRQRPGVEAECSADSPLANARQPNGAPVVYRGAIFPSKQLPGDAARVNASCCSGFADRQTPNPTDPQAGRLAARRYAHGGRHSLASGRAVTGDWLISQHLHEALEEVARTTPRSWQRIFSASHVTWYFADTRCRSKPTGSGRAAPYHAASADVPLKAKLAGPEAAHRRLCRSFASGNASRGHVVARIKIGGVLALPVDHEKNRPSLGFCKETARRVPMPVNCNAQIKVATRGLTIWPHGRPRYEGGSGRSFVGRPADGLPTFVEEIGEQDGACNQTHALGGEPSRAEGGL